MARGYGSGTNEDISSADLGATPCPSHAAIAWQGVPVVGLSIGDDDDDDDYHDDDGGLLVSRAVHDVHDSSC